MYKQELIENLNKVNQEHFPHIAKITPDMKIVRESVSRMVMLDRYAQKDLSLKTLGKGDLVVAKIKNDPMFPTLGIAYVESISEETVSIVVEQEYWGQIDKAFDHKLGKIIVDKKEISKPLEIFYEQIAQRVGHHLAEDEKEKGKWAKEFTDQLAKGNIVPAGRVLYGAGSGTNVTYFNCFVMPMIQDSRAGLADHRKEVMEIMSRGGGVGTNGSTLRPRGEVALGVGGKSSGAVTWLNDLATLTDLVQQGGSRRGAQMIMMQDWHPDIIEFIVSKMQKPEMLKWIADNFDDPLIKQYANEKLKFKPLTELQERIHQDIVSNTNDIKLLRHSQSALKTGGEYEVVAPEFLSGANISVGITQEFMEAVENDTTYKLRFPDIEAMTKDQKAFYDRKWHEIGDVREWEKLGYPVKTYKTIKAKELWDLINFCATYSAEPGVFFIDKANEKTNAKSYGQKVVCTNPCGEQPLAPYSVCNLAAINLSNFVEHKTGELLWDELDKAIKLSVRMQDNIIDKTPYFLEANKKQALGERRVGMGIMGLHDWLIWQGLRYGSHDALIVTDKLFKRIASVAYKTSAALGKEKGHFPFLKNVKDLLSTGYVKELPEDVKDEIEKAGGIRNSHLLTIAPTGSTGTMIGVSTGLEPYFAFKFYRSGRLGKFMEVDQKIVAEWRELKGVPSNKLLPEYFVSAMELTPEEHADTQVAIQRWVDSSISKTVNAPKGYTVKQVEKIYNRLYKNGAKGGTVYVDGSRDAQVLSISKSDVKSDSHEKTGPIELKKKTSSIAVTEWSEEKMHEIAEKHADVPNNKFGKDFGTDVGDVCPICKEGTVEDLGGCNSCTNCGAQLRCGI